MKIGIRMHDVAGATFEEKLASAQSQGFNCTHLALSKVMPEIPMAQTPELLTEELAEKVKSQLDAHGIGCAVLGCYLNLAMPDEEAYARTVEIYKAHLRFGKWIGATVVGTETGAPNVNYKTCPECFTEESLQLLIRRIRPVAEYAEEIGQNFAVEPVCRHILSTPERAAYLLEQYPQAHLRVILDAVNLISPANCGSAKEIIRRGIELLGDRISVLHIKDYINKSGDWFGSGVPDLKSVAAGTGCMDYTDLAAFSKAHPEIPMTLEDAKPDQAVAARTFVEDLFGN